MKIPFDEHEKYLVLNPSFDEYVTEICHGNHLSQPLRITKSQRKFLKKAYEINVIKHDLWSNSDFRPMTQFNFRKQLQRLRPFVEKVIDSRPSFYKLKRVHMPHSVTKNPRGLDPRDVEPEFEKILAELKQQPPMMHDIRVGTRISGLYENLLKRNIIPDPHNDSFSISLPVNSRFNVTANVYHESMQVIIGCTHKPLPYDLNGFHELSALLGQVCYHLEIICDSDFIHQHIPEWKVQYLHLNKDGREVNGTRFSYSISDLSNHSVFYLKKFKDGTFKNRSETHEKPNKTIEEITKSL